MQQRKIIILIVILFIASSFWLFFESNRQRNFDSGSFWWALSFKEAKGESLDFAIENHSDKTTFHWEALAGTDKIQEGDVEVPKGETLNTTFHDLDYSAFKNKKISVKVSAGEEAKEIYKNL